MELDEKVIKAIESEVEKSSHPDEKVLIVGRNSYSLREVLDEVRNQSELGIKMYSQFRALYYIKNPKEKK